jgi:hypothetical protein
MSIPADRTLLACVFSLYRRNIRLAGTLNQLQSRQIDDRICLSPRQQLLIKLRPNS